MFCGVLADTLLCPLPSPPLLHAIDILDSFLGIWHLKNLFCLGGMRKDWNWVFQQQLWDILVTQGRCKDDWTLWMQIHTSWWHHCASQQCHTSRGKSPPSAGVRAPVLGRAPGYLHSKHLGAWKGPHLFGCILSHLLRSKFLQGKGDGGKTTGRAASLPAVRKVMVKPAWALLGDIPEPVLLSCHTTYLQWDSSQIRTHFGLKIMQKVWPFLLSWGKTKPNQEYT